MICVCNKDVLQPYFTLTRRKKAGGVPSSVAVVLTPLYPSGSNIDNQLHHKDEICIIRIANGADI